ncbi:transmembrane protease serine 11D-like [Chironomus tepperi]|uniref:transmembrane protease serine 11D-like n=1 Tax=Chironomus tepperi TaxID=113505 RepID=UPI00391F2750
MKIYSTIVLLTSLIAITNAIFAGQSFENIPVPYFVRINVATEGIPALFVSGGSLISYQHVLCAGSTLQPNNRVINVHVGGNTRTSQRVFSIQRVIQHPQYVHNPRTNDIGIVVLAQTIRFDNIIWPIALPTEDKLYYLANSIQGLVLGFGGNAMSNQQVGSETLEGAFVRVNNATYCSSIYPNASTNSTFCAEDFSRRSDFCQQDIGGGFTVLQRGIEFLVGVASVPRCFQSTTIPSLPSLYTRVLPYVSWIREETGI